MTRPIPVSSQRKRPSKSCLACRAAKAKCTGLTEDYLHALDDPAALAAWNAPAQRCTRCTKAGHDCQFAPSRRKGRPRRLQRSHDEAPEEPVAENRSPASSGDSHSPRSSASTRRSPSPSTSQTSLPTPPTPLTDLAFLPAAAELLKPAPPPAPAPLAPVPSHSLIATRYLSTAHVWAPFLPQSYPVLHAYLVGTDPALSLAIACLLDPSLPAPSFDPAAFASPAPLAAIQTALLLTLHAYVTKDRARALALLQWACRELACLGWAGAATAPGLGGAERELVMRTGWYAWGVEIHLGFIAGVRASILAHVPPPASVEPATLQRHVLALAQQATDYAHLWALDPPARDSHIRETLSRAHALHALALSFLASAGAGTPAPQRSSLFSAGLISQTAIVLLLSSLSPLSPLIAPLLPCSLDTTSPPHPSARALIAAAARNIVALVRAYAPSTGAPAPAPAPATAGDSPHGGERTHSPFFGCCLVVAARGCLLAAEDVVAAPPPPPAGPNLALAQLAADLDLCEAELQRQSRHWPASGTLAAEVGLLRRTAGLV
ncbi:hypothetical protein JCM3770_001505 [Rhodotorula araucariae]